MREAMEKGGRLNGRGKAPRLCVILHVYGRCTLRAMPSPFQPPPPVKRRYRLGTSNTGATQVSQPLYGVLCMWRAERQGCDARVTYSP